VTPPRLHPRLGLAIAALLWAAGCTTFVPREHADDGGLAELPLGEVTPGDAPWDALADSTGEGSEDPDADGEIEADADADLGAEAGLDADPADADQPEIEPDTEVEVAPDSALEPGPETTTDAGDAADSAVDADASTDAELGPDAPDAVADADADADATVAPDPCAPGRVTLGPSGFSLNGADWRARMVGYGVEIRRPSVPGAEQWFIAPHWASCDDEICCTDTTSCLARLGADLDLAVLMGFNAVRLTGLDFRHPAGVSSLGCVQLGAQGTLQSCAPLELGVAAEREAAMDLIAGLLELAKARKLKVMLAVGRADVSEPSETSAHASLLKALGARFASDTTLFAYEVVEEVPQPTPPLLPTTATTRGVMANWYQAIRGTGAPQLVTLGLGDSGASVSFDPASLPVDFLGFHPHPLGGFDAAREAAYHAELTWLASTGRPWMVTATGFASGVWGSESEQVAFAQKSMVAARNCGALGYGWGQLRDASDGEVQGLGAVNGDSQLKAVAGIFKAIDLATPDAACPAAPASLNPTGASGFQVTGRLIDVAGKAVPFVRLTGWTCPVYGERFHTFSGADGKFTLRSGTGLVQVAISGSAKVPVTNILPKCITKNLGDTFITNASAALVVATPSCP
jgi:hypothetical protein